MTLLPTCLRRPLHLAHHVVQGWFLTLPFASAALITLAPAHARAADMEAINHPAQVASAVGAGAAVPGVGLGSILQTITALIIMIGVLFGAAWLARRLGYKPVPRGRVLKTIAQTTLGGKERAVVLEIGETWLVLGVAPGNVRLLHTMPADQPVAEPLPASGANDPLSRAYGQRFRDALKGEIGKRFHSRSGGDQ
ncbi:flagellar biosynthetic protein FliO [Paraburkholderia hayleyella]|uniref:flagellar biosynthetic protein FliO n=1 Tax=Paraburkholderia hayleyella TaxID=2152889 RepID=UPI001290FEDB|nr:flagellar biosynthetic protein FliO [Paraburkholderia hayleyella]